VKLRTVCALAGLAIATSSLFGQHATDPGTAAERKLFKNHHLLLALAAARGEKDVVVLVASRPGTNARAAEAIAALNGEVHYREDSVDYLRARVPLQNVERLAENPAVQSLDVDIDANQYDPTFDDLFPPEKEEPSNNPPDPDTPLSHPYMPEKDMDIDRFNSDHPTFDGRGVGVAILDATPDFLLPELQTATSLDGRPIRKIAGALAVSDPRDDKDPMWVKMDHTVKAEGGKFTYQDVTYIAPSDGEYRFGFFDERALKEPAYLYQDVNFDGNPEGSSGLFGVLWDEKKNVVWVDTNQNHSFADEKPMMDYSRRMDLGIFGANVPAGRRRKSVAFAVQTDPEKKYVRITLGVWQHITEVSGASLGKGFYGGSYNGVAPEAQLISVFWNPGVFRIVEAAITAAKLPNVDVICLEPSILEPTINPLQDGRLVAGVVFDRLSDKYHKLILSPANNSAGVNTVVDEVSSRKVMAVGAYQAGEAYRINNGAVVKNRDNLHLVGSFGPSGDGGLKPEILSASELISTDAGYKPPEKRKGVYELPPGYSVAGGTSTAGPTATAAVALLISAAKQTGVAYDPDRLRTALISSARYLPNIPAYKQGNGLVQVESAWELLKQMDKKFSPISIESCAPVHTAVSRYLQTPNEGRGIYEREGWRSGQRGTRTIIFTRTSGGTRPMMFRLEWVGNDGTFTSVESTTLPLNTPVELPVSIDANGAGVHSAILNLKRPGDPWIAYQVMNTVIAADDFTPENHYTVERKDAVERPGTLSFFLRVPPNTPALRIATEIPDAKPTLAEYVIPPDHNPSVEFGYVGETEKGRLTKTIRSPVPGVWEFVLWGNRFVFSPEQIDSKPLAAVPVAFTASLINVTADESTCQLDKTGVHGCPTEVTFSNKLGSFQGNAKNSSLGSARRLTDKIARGERKEYDIEVPPGAERISAAISQPSDATADLDLYLYQVVKGVAVLRDSSTGDSVDKNVQVDQPGAGQWKVVVDAFNVPSGATSYSYMDVFTHAAFGMIEIDDRPALRMTDAQWKVQPRISLGAVPAGERVLVGFVPVVSPETGKTGIGTGSPDDKNLKPPLSLGFANFVFK